MRQLVLVSTLLLCPPGTAAAQADTLPRQAVLANGYRFAYVERGRGPTLLLVHGALTDYRFWQPQLDSLSDRFHVIAVSRRYHYPNPWRPDDPPSDFATTAADLAALIRALRLDRPVVVAHSWATLAALELLRRHPSLVGGLILANPVADSLIPDPAHRHRAAVERARAYAEALAVFDPRAPVPALNRLLTAWFGGTTFDSLAPGQRERLLANAQTLASAAASQPTVACALLRDGAAPILLIGGGESPPEERETLLGAEVCLPAARILIVPGAGRTLPRSSAGSFATAVRDFMQLRAP